MPRLAMPATTADTRAPRSTTLGAFLEGWRRTLMAPSITLGVSAFAVFVAWLLEITLATPFAAATAAFHAARTNLEWRVVEPQTMRVVIACVVAWLFVSGGILDRMARARPIRTAAFFAACGVYMMRFLRLALLLAPFYWLLFYFLYPYLFGTLWTRWTHAFTTVREGIEIRAPFYALVVLALVLLHLVSAYAKVRTVVEDRRSMIGTAGAAIRFVRRRPFRIAGLLFMNVFTMAAMVRLWYSAAPVASDSAVYAFFVTHVFVVLFTWARVAWMASEVVFFQGELAHATYTAAPIPVWPDSPAAEALENLRSL